MGLGVRAVPRSFIEIDAHHYAYPKRTVPDALYLIILANIVTSLNIIEDFDQMDSTTEVLQIQCLLKLFYLPSPS